VPAGTKYGASSWTATAVQPDSSALISPEPRTLRRGGALWRCDILGIVAVTVTANDNAMDSKANPALRIRESRASDVGAILRIYAEEVRTGTASFELVAPSREEMSVRRESLLAAGFPYLVAELGDLFAGYAYAGPYRTRPAYRFTVENSVYVAKRARKRGVGLQLLNTLISECEAGGFRQMVAIIGDSRHTASIQLHSRAGFRLVGTIQNVGMKFGGWLDSVLMQRALGEGANTIPTEPLHDG